MSGSIQKSGKHVVESQDAGEMGTRYKITNTETGSEAVLVTDKHYHIVTDNAAPHPHIAYHGDDSKSAADAVRKLVND